MLSVDSKTINKLIRSEVWPILRAQGFNAFSSRSAFAYNPPFINVVSFQSFNSYLAGGLGCTTYSFTPRLGVYVVGSPGEDGVKRDKAGCLQPLEYQCAFRSELRKRTPVDGFARDDIFYIDPEGTTTPKCFEELKYLCSEFVPLWFNGNNNLDDILSRIRLAEASPTPVSDVAASPGSYNWNRLNSVLLLIKHQQSPNEQSAVEALKAISRVIGNILDFSAFHAGQPGQERYVIEVRELWDKLADFRSVEFVGADSMTMSGSLDGPLWAAAPTSRESKVPSLNLTNGISARKQFWPMLRNVGFSEFTDRLAHRVSIESVEVVEILPVDPTERRAWTLPPGLFRIGLGVYWPLLGEDGLSRKNRMGEARPRVGECHISNWLSPETEVYKDARTAFDLIEEALGALTGPGIRWLDIWRNYDQAMTFLQRNDWELFCRYPMMRGLGAGPSSRRLIYIGYLERLLGGNAESQDHIQQAEEALHNWYPVHLYSRHEAWVRQVKARLCELDEHPMPRNQL
jgi:hypothetical protein